MVITLVVAGAVAFVLIGLVTRPTQPTVPRVLDLTSLVGRKR
jgi:hypothetical protein